MKTRPNYIDVKGVGRLTDFIREDDSEALEAIQKLGISTAEPYSAPEGYLTLTPQEFNDLARAGIKIPTLEQTMQILSTTQGKEFLNQSLNRDYLTEEVLNARIIQIDRCIKVSEANREYNIDLPEPNSEVPGFKEFLFDADQAQNGWPVRNNPSGRLLMHLHSGKSPLFLTSLPNSSYDLAFKVSEEEERMPDTDFGQTYFLARRIISPQD